MILDNFLKVRVNERAIGVEPVLTLKIKMSDSMVKIVLYRQSLGCLI